MVVKIASEIVDKAVIALVVGTFFDVIARLTDTPTTSNNKMLSITIVALFKDVGIAWSKTFFWFSLIEYLKKNL